MSRNFDLTGKIFNFEFFSESIDAVIQHLEYNSLKTQFIEMTNSCNGDFK